MDEGLPQNHEKKQPRISLIPKYCTQKASNGIYPTRDVNYMFPPIIARNGTVHHTLNKCHQHRIAWLPAPGLTSLEISNINCWTWRCTCTLLCFSFGVKSVYVYIWFNDVKLLAAMKTLLKQ